MHMIRILICQCTHSSDFKPQEEEEEVKDNWISYSRDVFLTAHEHRVDSSFVSLLNPTPLHLVHGNIFKTYPVYGVKKFGDPVLGYFLYYIQVVHVQMRSF